MGCVFLQALRCLKLYLERLGCVFAPDGTCANQEDIQDVLELVARTVTDNEFLNYRPTITAAAVLYCERLHKGHLPFWPSSLAGLTSYSNAHTPELSAAIGGAQRLWKQLVASRQPASTEVAADGAAAGTAGEAAATAGAAGENDADKAAAGKTEVEEATAQLAAVKV
jgi:pentatricopeptide repeat domain-containing protein 1